MSDTLSTLAKEYEFVQNNLQSLQKNYANRFIAIKDGAVEASGDNKIAVVRDMLSEGFGLGTFLVHLIRLERDLVHRYRSRIK